MAEKIRKQIDLEKEIIKELKILAAHADKDVKNYLQDLVVQHVRDSKNKKDKQRFGSFTVAPSDGRTDGRDKS
ncbi:MAG TPA: hypothetical protein VG737_11640 [Cyclobacteriaceae bacterium]|nr:hypothetical protein [Cyclobacteriaceae bacterium]